MKTFLYFSTENCCTRRTIFSHLFNNRIPIATTIPSHQRQITKHSEAHPNIRHRRTAAARFPHFSGQLALIIACTESQSIDSLYVYTPPRLGTRNKRVHARSRGGAPNRQGNEVTGSSRQPSERIDRRRRRLSVCIPARCKERTRRLERFARSLCKTRRREKKREEKREKLSARGERGIVGYKACRSTTVSGGGGGIVSRRRRRRAMQIFRRATSELSLGRARVFFFLIVNRHRSVVVVLRGFEYMHSVCINVCILEEMMKYWIWHL